MPRAQTRNRPAQTTQTQKQPRLTRAEARPSGRHLFRWRSKWARSSSHRAAKTQREGDGKDLATTQSSRLDRTAAARPLREASWPKEVPGCGRAGLSRALSRAAWVWLVLFAVHRPLGYRSVRESLRVSTNARATAGSPGLRAHGRSSGQAA